MGAILVFASIFISKWGYRFGIPTLLLFLFTGMLFGVDGLGLEFDSHENAQLIGMLSLSVILFSGGMETKLEAAEKVTEYGIPMILANGSEEKILSELQSGNKKATLFLAKE